MNIHFFFRRFQNGNGYGNMTEYFILIACVHCTYSLAPSFLLKPQILMNEIVWHNIFQIRCVVVFKHKFTHEIERAEGKRKEKGGEERALFVSQCADYYQRFQRLVLQLCDVNKVIKIKLIEYKILN